MLSQNKRQRTSKIRNSWGFPILAPGIVKINKSDELNNASLINFDINSPNRVFDLESFKPVSIESNYAQNELIELEPIYDINKPYDRAILESLEYPEKYRNTIKNQLMCGKGIKEYACPNDCGIVKRVLMTCKTNFCNHKQCLRVRISRNLNYLNNLIINSRRLYHFSIGSNRLTIKELSKTITQYVQSMRKKGYKIQYIKVFDINKKTKNHWFHYHIALLPESKLSNINQFMDDSKSYLNKTKALFNNIGWRSKQNIFSYFAKRQAGQFGHKNQGYYNYPDVMSRLEWLENHLRKKNLTKSTAIKSGLIYTINGHNSEPNLCPLCETKLLFSFNDYNAEQNFKKPPGTYQINENNELIPFNMLV